MNLTLPKMNGTIDVGISVGTDMGLPESDRLQIHSAAGDNEDTSKMRTLRQVYNCCADIKKFDASVCEMAVFAVYGAMEMGLVSDVSNDVVNVDLNNVEENRADELIKRKDIRERTQAALTLLVTQHNKRGRSDPEHLSTNFGQQRR